MHHLVLTQGLTYWGRVKATKDHPDVYVEDGPDYEAAMASGYFKETDNMIAIPMEKAKADKTEDQEKAEVPEDEPADMATELSKMTIAELRAYAEIKGISVDGKAKKEAILEAIIEAERRADGIRASFRSAGKGV